MRKFNAIGQVPKLKEIAKDRIDYAASRKQKKSQNNETVAGNFGVEELDYHQLEALEAEVHGMVSDAALRSFRVSEMGRAFGHSPEEDSMMPVPCEKHSQIVTFSSTAGVELEESGIPSVFHNLLFSAGLDLETLLMVADRDLYLASELEKAGIEKPGDRIKIVKALALLRGQ